MEGGLVKGSYNKKFVKLFDSLCRTRPKYTVWYDIIQMWAYAISNSCNYRQDREDKYLAIAKSYTKDELMIICELYAAVVLAFDENPEQDFLGQLYMDYGFGDHKKGEFFTPYEVARFFSEVLCFECNPSRGYAVINEPACGSGVMLIAYINKLVRDKQSPHTRALFIANDTNPCIAMMCYIQLSLIGAAGYVLVQDTLAEPLTGHVLYPLQNAFITPLFFHPIWNYRRVISWITQNLKEV